MKIKLNLKIIFLIALLILPLFSIVFGAITVTENYEVAEGTANNSWKFYSTTGSAIQNTTGYWLTGKAIRNQSAAPANTTYDGWAYLKTSTDNGQIIGFCDEGKSDASTCKNGYYLFINQNTIYKVLAGSASNMGALTDVTENARYHRIIINSTGVCGLTSADAVTWTTRGCYANVEVSRTKLYLIMGQNDQVKTQWSNSTIWYHALDPNAENYNSSIIQDNSSAEKVFNYNEDFNLTFCTKSHNYNTAGYVPEPLNMNISQIGLYCVNGTIITTGPLKNCTYFTFRDNSTYTAYNFTANVWSIFNSTVNINPLVISIRTPNFLYMIWQNTNLILSQSTSSLTSAINTTVYNINNTVNDIKDGIYCPLNLYSESDFETRCADKFANIFYNHTFMGAISMIALNSTAKYFNDTFTAERNKGFTECNLDSVRYENILANHTAFPIINYAYAYCAANIEWDLCNIGNIIRMIAGVME